MPFHQSLPKPRNAKERLLERLRKREAAAIENEEEAFSAPGRRNAPETRTRPGTSAGRAAGVTPVASTSRERVTEMAQAIGGPAGALATPSRDMSARTSPGGETSVAQRVAELANMIRLGAIGLNDEQRVSIEREPDIDIVRWQLVNQGTLSEDMVFGTPSGDWVSVPELADMVRDQRMSESTEAGLDDKERVVAEKFFNKTPHIDMLRGKLFIYEPPHSNAKIALLEFDTKRFARAAESLAKAAKEQETPPIMTIAFLKNAGSRFAVLRHATPPQSNTSYLWDLEDAPAEHVSPDFWDSSNAGKDEALPRPVRREKALPRPPKGKASVKKADAIALSKASQAASPSRLPRITISQLARGQLLSPDLPASAHTCIEKVFDDIRNRRFKAGKKYGDYYFWDLSGLSNAGGRGAWRLLFSSLKSAPMFEGIADHHDDKGGKRVFFWQK